MTPLDKAAMAIAIVRGKQWAALSDTERKLYREDARAAMVSLQEPSDEMVAEGLEHLEYDMDEGGLVGGTSELVERMFTAMVKRAAR